MSSPGYPPVVRKFIRAGSVLPGQKFGRLTTIHIARKNKHGAHYWLCLCQCGKKTVVHYGNLKRDTRSCGCLSRELASKRATTHGHTANGVKTPEFNKWVAMRFRCLNSKIQRYKNYGGRGIQICSRWIRFENFLLDMGPCPVGLTLERKDNDGDYCKSNCRWATRREQGFNKTTSHRLTVRGVTKTITEWAIEYGLTSHILRWIIRHNWSGDRILTPRTWSKYG